MKKIILFIVFVLMWIGQAFAWYEVSPNPYDTTWNTVYYIFEDGIYFEFNSTNCDMGRQLNDNSFLCEFWASGISSWPWPDYLYIFSEEVESTGSNSELIESINNVWSGAVSGTTTLLSGSYWLITIGILAIILLWIIIGLIYKALFKSNN